MKVIFIRHGMTQGNVERRFVGNRTDQPLIYEGKEKLKNIEYKYVDKVDVVYASPMKRCMETANIIFPNHCINKVEDLREIDFGRFEAKTHNELKDDVSYQKWVDSNGFSDIPEGESFDEFCDRCASAFYDVIENESSEFVAFVVHGGTIMALMHKFSEREYFEALVDNGRGFLCEFENNCLKVIDKI